MKAKICASIIYPNRWTVRQAGSAVSTVFGSLGDAVTYCKDRNIAYEVQ